jgi:hypothetical protein
MNPVTALMLARAIEQERRRAIERRPRRPLSEPMDRPAARRRGWTIRLPRFGIAGSKA